MESKENLVFLGMMGSGKSSIGSIISKKLNIDFIDIDYEIEKKIGMTVSQIFENEGEEHFRKIEEMLTLKLLNKSKIVISLGGGAFLNNKIRKEILENHISFWLNWDIKTLISRIKDSKKRPVAFKASKNELADIIKKRSIVYSKAMYKINCENLTKNEIAKNILKIYEAYQAKYSH
jgi:shikimate kinase